ASKLVLRTAHQKERVASQRYDINLRPRRRIRHYANIDDVVDYIFVYLVRPAVFDMHIHLRVRLDEAFQYWRQLVNTNGVDSRDPNLSADDIAEALHLFGERVEAIDDLPASLIEGHTRGCRGHGAASASLNQLAIELIL